MGLIPIEEHFKELATRSNVNQELFACWQMSKIEYSKLLDNIKLSYPYFSQHDSSHSQNIIQNIERLLGNEGISNLGITDSWLLLECAYIHDLGMILDMEKVKRDWSMPEFKLYSL